MENYLQTSNIEDMSITVSGQDAIIEPKAVTPQTMAVSDMAQLANTRLSDLNMLLQSALQQQSSCAAQLDETNASVTDLQTRIAKVEAIIASLPQE